MGWRSQPMRRRSSLTNLQHSCREILVVEEGKGFKYAMMGLDGGPFEHRGRVPWGLRPDRAGPQHELLWATARPLETIDQFQGLYSFALRQDGDRTSGRPAVLCGRRVEAGHWRTRCKRSSAAQWPKKFVTEACATPRSKPGMYKRAGSKIPCASLHGLLWRQSGTEYTAHRKSCARSTAGAPDPLEGHNEIMRGH